MVDYSRLASHNATSFKCLLFGLHLSSFELSSCLLLERHVIGGLLLFLLHQEVALLLLSELLLSSEVCFLLFLLSSLHLLSLFLGTLLLKSAVGDILVSFLLASDGSVDIVFEVKLNAMGKLDVHECRLVHVSINVDVVFAVFADAHWRQDSLLSGRLLRERLLGWLCGRGLAS